MQRRLFCRLGVYVALSTASAAGQQPAAAPAPASTVAPSAAPAPASAPAPAPACFPACRDGFTCHQGACVSLCNPPCPEGLECVAGRSCEPPVPGASRQRKVYEPPAPPVKGFEERSHTLLGFHLGLPGKLDQDDRGQDLATTYGFNVRSDSPVASYVLIGPMLQLGAWSPDISPDPDNSYYVDLDFVIRLRAPISTKHVNYQLWVGMPVGVTVDVLGDDVPNVSSFGIGWNIGVLFGGAVHLTPKFGFFAEGGWMQHKIEHSAEVGSDLDFALRQWCLNLGIVVKN